MNSVGSILTVCLALSALSGCTPNKPVAPKPVSKKADEKDSSVRGSVKGENWQVAWKTRNIKNPNGPPLLVMKGFAASGEIEATDDQPTATLYNLNAKIYQEGKPTANIQAPEINADRENHQVIGAGGVTLVSLQKAAGTVVHADTVEWNLETGKMVAEGNASVKRKARDGQPDILQTGNRILFDSKLDEFIVE